MSPVQTSVAPARRILSLIGAMTLGAILVIATLGKMADPIVFVELIHNEGLDFLLSANTVALIALALETFLGLALLLGVRSIWIVAPSAGLVGFFIALTGWNYYLVLTAQRDVAYDCGCFGVFLHRTAVQAFWQDLPMLLIPLILILLDRPALWRPGAHWKMSVSLAGTVAVLAYTAYGVGLPTTPLPGGSTESTSAELIFQPSGQFELMIDDSPDADGKVLECSETLQMMLVSAAFSKPVLLDIRSSRVAELETEPQPIASGGMTVPRDPSIKELGNFTVGPNGLDFEIDGHRVALHNR